MGSPIANSAPTVSNLQAKLVQVQGLQEGDREAMYGLLDHHFEGVTPATFTADLAQKHWAILLYHQTELKGFSTLAFYPSEFQSHPIEVVYSGDTIMAPEVWSSSILPRAWIGAVNALRSPDRPLYWLLICSGFRTYRFLPTFWQTFYPRYDAPTPPLMQALKDRLAVARFGSSYDPATGIVQLSHPQVLRPGLRGIPEARQANPHVQFFAQRNPGHLQGDELVCLTELAETNLTSAGRRMWAAGDCLELPESLR